MKKHLFSLIISVSCLHFVGCISLRPQVKLLPTEGVRGQVFEKKGNKMPMKGQETTKGAILNTVVYVFEPTTLLKVEGLNGQTCTKINSALVDSARTDIDGKYIIGLKPGKYSLLVKYGTGYFVPYFSGGNELSIIEILPKTFSELDIIVNAKASY